MLNFRIFLVCMRTSLLGYTYYYQDYACPKYLTEEMEVETRPDVCEDCRARTRIPSNCPQAQ